MIIRTGKSRDEKNVPAFYILIKMEEQIKYDPNNFRKHSSRNKRIIRKSLEDFGGGRSVLIDNDDYLIAGNGVFEESQKLGMPIKVIETDGSELIVVKRKDLSLDDEKRKKLALIDNHASDTSEFDFDLVYENFTVDDLKEFEFDFAVEDDVSGDIQDDNIDDLEDDPDNDTDDNDDFYSSMVQDVLFESGNEFEIPNLLIEKQANKLLLPFAPWGADSRLRRDVSTYHFYVDDYRFEAIWKDPIKLITSGVKVIVEPNLSLYDTTPVAFGLHQIYKKRWISRYLQECGILVYADLNVSVKFAEYNKLGIPPGYNAFFTRGYTGRLEYLKKELEVAGEISGQKTPNLLVYGGGEEIRNFCIENSLVYVEQFMQNKKQGNG